MSDVLKMTGKIMDGHEGIHFVDNMMKENEIKLNKDSIQREQYKLAQEREKLNIDKKQLRWTITTSIVLILTLIVTIVSIVLQFMK